MFVSCLHCRELVAIDRESGLAPDMCPRCGGLLREGADAATEASTADTAATGPRSFISFLQAGETATATFSESAKGTGVEAIVDETNRDPTPPEDVDAEPPGIEADAESIGQPAPGVEPEQIDPEQIDPERIDARPSDPVSTTVPMPSAPAADKQALAAMPSFSRQVMRPGANPRTTGWQWTMLIALSLGLALQVLLADRARLAADASWRPLVMRLCGVLGCSVPLWHQPGAFSMLSRDVSPIAGSDGGLGVQATFRNDARWSQAWPVLLLSLSDADGRVLGSRAFTPREYLGAAATQTELAPGQSAQIALQLHEPNPDVVAFTFDFR